MYSSAMIVLVRKMRSLGRTQDIFQTIAGTSWFWKCERSTDPNYGRLDECLPRFAPTENRPNCEAASLRLKSEWT
jgi:hypothetical protein